VLPDDKGWLLWKARNQSLTPKYTPKANWFCRLIADDVRNVSYIITRPFNTAQ
jgi:hypothetical protein